VLAGVGLELCNIASFLVEGQACGFFAKSQTPGVNKKLTLGKKACNSACFASES
jgi:hypothetical protein